MRRTATGEAVVPGEAIDHKGYGLTPLTTRHRDCWFMAVASDTAMSGFACRRSEVYVSPGGLTSRKVERLDPKTLVYPEGTPLG